MLYPVNPPYESGYFPTGDGHELYYERHGNPQGEPAVYLHGGPGGGCNFKEGRYFNPEKYDVLLFDQRGAGKSRPHASIENNSVDHLVADLERLRRHFGYASWSVTGGSWGAALGMLYTVRHPQHVKRLLLRGLFLMDPKDRRDLIDEDGVAATHRNQWFENYYNHIPPPERVHGLTQPYYQRLLKDDTEAYECAKLFNLWDTSIANATLRQEAMDDVEKDPAGNLALARLFFHFTVHDYPKPYHTEILDGLSQLAIPVDIIHGRQDYICPLADSIRVDNVCQNSRLQILENCGHSMKEPALQRAFVGITDRWLRDKE